MNKIMLKIADKILIKCHGKAKVNNVYLVRMSLPFYEWVYGEGYKAYCEGGEAQ